MVIFRSYVSLPEGKGFQTFGFVFRVFIQYIYIHMYFYTGNVKFPKHNI
jgi:hypothetical protein